MRPAVTPTGGARFGPLTGRAMLGQKAALWHRVDGATAYSGYPCSPLMPWEGAVVGFGAGSPGVRMSDLDGGIMAPSPARVFGSLSREAGVVVVEGDAGVEGARRGWVPSVLG